MFPEAHLSKSQELFVPFARLYKWQKWNCSMIRNTSSAHFTVHPGNVLKERRSNSVPAHSLACWWHVQPYFSFIRNLNGPFQQLVAKSGLLKTKWRVKGKSRAKPHNLFQKSRTKTLNSNLLYRFVGFPPGIDLSAFIPCLPFLPKKTSFTPAQRLCTCSYDVYGC